MVVIQIVNVFARNHIDLLVPLMIQVPEGTHLFRLAQSKVWEIFLYNRHLLNSLLMAEYFTSTAISPFSRSAISLGI